MAELALFNFNENVMSYKFKYADLLNDEVFKLVFGRESTKTVDELDGNILEGMYFCFKNMPELESRPEVLDHHVFTKIFDVTELYNMDQDTRDKVLDNMTTERDLKNQMIYAREEGREEGIALAINNMAESGLDAEQIAEIMKMSVADVQAMIS